MPHWEGAYGFSFFQVDAVTVTGMGNYLTLETNYITGEFDEETIAERLAGLGYRTEPVGDDFYHAIRDDFEQDLSLTNEATRSALGNAALARSTRLPDLWPTVRNSRHSATSGAAGPKACSPSGCSSRVTTLGSGRPG